MKNNRFGQAAILTNSDYSKIRKQINNQKFRVLFDLAYYTGERWGALVQVQIEDVWDDDKLREEITFRANTRKGKQDTRQIPIHPTLKEILQNYNSQSEWLFPQKRNPLKHISLRAADYALRDAVAKAGLAAKGIATHSTRRTFITKLHQNGVSLETIRRITGHRNFQSLTRYVEVEQKEITGAIGLL